MRATGGPKRWTLATTGIAVVLGVIGASGQAYAQTAQAKRGDEAPSSVDEVVVTGSRIRTSSDTTSPAPVAVIGADAVDQKGFVQVGDVLREMTSITPSAARPSLTNGQSLLGQDYPNLFNLGPARTLSLLNGRRMTASSSGLGDEAVDANIIPIGLLERIDVVQGGGASVYGSGAIGGVVNYVLKKNYDGQEVLLQYGSDSRGTYDKFSARGVVGRNFAGGRGNVAAELNYSTTGAVQAFERPTRAVPAWAVASNPQPGAGQNGIPLSIYVKDNAAPYEDASGLVVNSALGLFATNVIQVGGRGVTIDTAGNIATLGLGTPIFGQPLFTAGSDLDWRIGQVNSFVPKVERHIATMIGGYELTDHVRLSAELLYARTKATAPRTSLVNMQFLPALSLSFPRLGAIPFTNANAYLSPATVAQLSSLNPGFAAGQPLFYSKNFLNFGRYLDQSFTTEVKRAVVAIEGDFEAIDRKFFWEASYSRSEVRSKVDGYAILFPNFNRAVNAVRNSAGQIVCAVNVTVVTDPSCVPYNMFGTAPISPEAANYILGRGTGGGSGAIGNVLNTQDDFLAALNGDLLRLPGGMSKFSVAYEHRSQEAKFTPLAADAAAMSFTGIPTRAGSGSYKTNEFAAELRVPLLGGDFALPFVEALDLSASYRFVDNSLAGSDSVWGLAGRWQVGGGLVLRATKSRNFRAPSINQVLAPPVVGIGPANVNPCGRLQITNGPNPSVRAANCLTLFAANPTFGLSSLPAGVANTPANRLANFTATVVAQVQTTTRGNPDLENEIADTTTVGFVYQPSMVPGLTISADMLRIDLAKALTLFSVGNYAATCFDASPQPAEFCSPLGYDVNGDLNRGIASTVNAGALKLHAEIYNIDYRFPLSQLSENLPGSMNLVLQATHNTLQTVTFAGTTTRQDGTPNLPTWVLRFDTRYTNGPLRLNYSLNYLPATLINRTATVENSPDGVFKLKENYRHDISAEYLFRDKYTLRAGVNNVTDELPSYPSVTFGEILGREYFVALRATF